MSSTNQVRSAADQMYVEKTGFVVQCVVPMVLRDHHFESGGEIKTSVDVIKYRTGGSLIPVKQPGNADYPSWNATRAVTRGGRDLYDWHKMVNDPMKLGWVEGECYDYKFDISIFALSRCHRSVKGWRLVNAWLADYTATDGFDANSSDLMKESGTWEYDYFLEIEGASGAQVTITVGQFSVELSGGTWGARLPS